MKKINYLIIIALVVSVVALLLSFTNPSESSEGEIKWLQVTSIESVVPGGLGRSRMITIDDKGKMEEIKMKNFFSMAGINFSNIRENDGMITEKIKELTNDDWELHNITSGVYAGNENNSTGIFITRYLFKK
ncbi:MAG: hypothetical protein K8S00_06440 [Bacteroidales bacterium]|nr:hypothetical protein [Bacteroidales bacterium]